MTTRRSFLKNSGMLAAGLSISSLASQAVAADKKNAQGGRVNMAVIGVGMGLNDISRAMESCGWVHCLGICDVDQERLKERSDELRRRHPDQTTEMKLYGDFREVLANKDIDAVVIGTPDHWHTYMFAEALKAGKAVYIEKPVANSIAECNLMMDLQKKYQRVVTTGLWQTSQRYFRGANDILRTGVLGDVYKVHIWLCQSSNPAPSVEDAAAPSTFDYDMWLGPAPQRPYNSVRARAWRGFWDYGGGQQTDWGVHWIDSAFDGLEALGLNSRTFPKAVFSCGHRHPDTALETPSMQSTIFQYDNFHIEWSQQVAHLYNRNQGVAWIGSKGTLVCNRDGYELIPGTSADGTWLMQSQQMTGPYEDYGLYNHARNWSECVRDKNIATNSPIEKGAFATILAHMANISYHTGTKVVYDPKTRKFVDNPEANKYLKPNYRASWKFPEV